MLDDMTGFLKFSIVVIIDIMVSKGIFFPWKMHAELFNGGGS